MRPHRTNRLVMTLLLAIPLIGCTGNGANLGTPEQRQAAYEAAVGACNLFADKPADKARCIEAAALARLVSDVFAGNPPPNAPPGARTAKAAGAQRQRLAEVYSSAAAGVIPVDAAAEYVWKGGQPAGR